MQYTLICGSFYICKFGLYFHLGRVIKSVGPFIIPILLVKLLQEMKNTCFFTCNCKKDNSVLIVKTSLFGLCTSKCFPPIVGKFIHKSLEILLWVDCLKERNQDMRNNEQILNVIHICYRKWINGKSAQVVLLAYLFTLLFLLLTLVKCHIPYVKRGMTSKCYVFCVQETLAVCQYLTCTDHIPHYSQAMRTSKWNQCCITSTLLSRG